MSSAHRRRTVRSEYNRIFVSNQPICVTMPAMSPNMISSPAPRGSVTPDGVSCRRTPCATRSKLVVERQQQPVNHVAERLLARQSDYDRSRPGESDERGEGDTLAAYAAGLVA